MVINISLKLVQKGIFSFNCPKTDFFQSSIFYKKSQILYILEKVSPKEAQNKL